MGLLTYGLLKKTDYNLPEDQAITKMGGDNIVPFNETLFANITNCKLSNTYLTDHKLVLVLTNASDTSNSLTCEKIIIIDILTGKRIGTLSLHP